MNTQNEARTIGAARLPRPMPGWQPGQGAGQDDGRCRTGHARAGRDAALSGRGACGDHRPAAGGGGQRTEHEPGREGSRAGPAGKHARHPGRMASRLPTPGPAGTGRRAREGAGPLLPPGRGILLVPPVRCARTAFRNTAHGGLPAWCAPSGCGARLPVPGRGPGRFPEFAPPVYAQLDRFPAEHAVAAGDALPQAGDTQLGRRAASMNPARSRGRRPSLDAR